MSSLRPHGLQLASSRSLSKPMSIESVMRSNHLIPCHPLLLLPSIFPSIRVFSNESALHIRWPKYWSFSFNISPSNENSGLQFMRSQRVRHDWAHTHIHSLNYPTPQSFEFPISGSAVCLPIGRCLVPTHILSPTSFLVLPQSTSLSSRSSWMGMTWALEQKKPRVES